MHLSLGGDRYLGVRVASRALPPAAGASRSNPQAPPVLLLHGFMGSALSWPESLVAALAQDTTVIVPDLPGHGDSDPSPHPHRYEVGQVAADLIALLDHLDVERAHVVGYSMGGRLALALAHEHPDRIERLVVEAASPGLESEMDRRARRAADEALALRLSTASFEAFVDDWMARPLFETQRSLGADWRLAERQRRLEADPVALAACLRGMGTGSQPPYWGALDTWTHPTLLLTGDLDEKFCGIAERMAAASSALRWTSVPDAGHRVHVERPDVWLDHVRSFLFD